jgi:hypothetical protein
MASTTATVKGWYRDCLAAYAIVGFALIPLACIRRGGIHRMAVVSHRGVAEGETMAMPATKPLVRPLVAT